MSSGADALEDKDFQVKFLETGSKEMDKLIGVYNHMIDNLREERTESQEKHFFMEQVLETSISAIILLDFVIQNADHSLSDYPTCGIKSSFSN